MKKHFLLASSALAMPAYIPVLPSAHDNTLTGLIPDLYAGLDVVSRELTGMIPAVTINANDVERAAKNQDVTYHIAPPGNGVDISPAMATPEPTDQIIGTGQIKITKARAYEFGYTGEERRGLNTGPGYLSVQADQFAQALRGLTNEITVDLAVEAASRASRAAGTAGATPFASDTSGSSYLKKVLDDNGAPPGRSLVIDTTAGAKLRTLLGINAQRPAQDMLTMQQGTLTDLQGFTTGESAGIVTHVKGTAANATTTAAGFAKGATVIALASAGTGEILAGDVITFAGDANQYLVVVGEDDVSDGGSITIAAPGLMEAIPTAATNVTVLASHTKNVGFARSAMHLVIRPPALPENNRDAAVDRHMLVDPRSGLPFEVSVYLGYRKVRFEVAAAWGVRGVKPEHIAVLLG